MCVCVSDCLFEECVCVCLGVIVCVCAFLGVLM